MLELLASLLVGAGVLMMIAAGLWVTIIALQEGEYWILLSAICGPPVFLFYVYQNFDDLQNQFILFCGGFVAWGVGFGIMASLAG